MTELFWIAVPAGLAADGLASARVLIIPRLDGVTVTGAGLGSWPPAGFAGASLEILVDGQTGAAPQVISKPLQIVAQPGLWNAFFGGEIPLNTVAKSRKMTVEVKKVSEHADAVATTFAQVATKPVVSQSQDRTQLSGEIDRQLRERWRGTPAVESPAVLQPGVEPGPPDFNNIIGLLREHPNVLESLGLIFELPLGILPPQKGRIKVRVQGVTAGALPPNVSPWSRFAGGFRPASDGSTLTAGMLALDERAPGSGGPPRAVWQLVAFDVESAAARLHQAAQALPPDATENAGQRSLPALRTVGISFVHRGRQLAFDRRGNRSNAALTDESELDAEQLLLGYRFDVKPENTNSWSSLHRRKATYTVARGGATLEIGSAVLMEEGHTKPAAAVDLGDGLLRADETVARWNGWNLSVPKPAIAPKDETRPSIPSRAAPPYDFRFSFDVDGRLPKLRFSQSYRFRARLADVTGGGLKADDPDADRAFTDAFTYLRFEPINVPLVRLPEGDVPGPGETADLIAIRSDAGLSVEEFLTANPQYRLPGVRLVDPPRAPLMLAEQHGAFDMVSPDRSWTWVENSFLRNDSGSDPLLPDFAVVSLSVFPLIEPGAPPSAAQPRAWTEAWPDLRAKRLLLRERTGSQPVLSWESDAQGIDTLVVRLAQAECLTLELSCRPKGNFVDHFAAQTAMPTESLDAVRDGRHPLVTPVRVVKLVHAVQRPLGEPRGTLAAKRIPGQTTVDLTPSSVRLNVDPNSTSQLDLAVVDLDVVPPQTPAVVQSVAVDRGDTALREPLRHELGDTKHRRLHYTGIAHSRFPDLFATTATGFTAAGDLGIVSVPNSARPPALSIRSVRPAILWQNEPLQGDEIVRRRRAGGIIRVELDGPWNLTGAGEQVAAVVWADSNPPGAVWPFLTQAGRDPILPNQYPDRFPAPGLFKTSGQAASVFLEEAKSKVAVVPFNVVQEGAVCYCDIEVPGIIASSYLPFIRFGLARYQRDSLERLALSPVVFTEFVQPLPERLLVVRRVGESLKLRLSGDPAALDIFAGTRVDVVVQQLSPADADVNTALSAEGPPDLPVAAWVTNPALSLTFGVGSDFDLRLPSGPGPVRIKIAEVDHRTRSSPHFTPSLASLNAHTTYLDVINL